MPAKRGRLSHEEREYIIVHVGKQSPAEIAAHLNRTLPTVEEFVRSRGLRPFTKAEADKEEKLTIRSSLRTSQKWKRLEEELTGDELRFFEEEYLKLMGQFRGDVLASEETQVFDCIRFDIFKSRNMAARRRGREEISRLDRAQDELLKKYKGDMGKMPEKDRSACLAMGSRVAELHESERDFTVEYVKLQERHDALLRALKSTRDQRIKEVDSGTESILGLFKKLMRDEGLRRSEGREMELMKMAGAKEYDHLGHLHKYEDGQEDRPILSADTVGLGDEEETEAGDKSEDIVDI